MLGLALIHLPLRAESTARPPRGYFAQACGFDMDRDGVFGEPEDCQVCDSVTSDPDGDGVAEDLLYVDCDSGVDDADCGTPNDPCRTIRQAWMVRADGPVDGAEDIVCFRGTCTTEEVLNPTFGGVAGATPFYTVEAAGSEERDWRYPKNPTMLVGWDHDNDGIYPPFDSDDVAVIDGAAGRDRVFRLNIQTDHLEMGHFTVKDYGRFTTGNDTGFVAWGPSFGVIEYQFFHDLELISINQDRDTTSAVSLINLFPSNALPQWIAFKNLKATDNGQWFARGAGYNQGPDMGPFRFQNIYRTAHSCDFAVCGSSAATVGFKVWGYFSGVEILDSIWDANVNAWQPKPTGGPAGATFAFPVQCTRDWLIRNNEVIDHKIGFLVEGHSAGFCDGAAARSIDNIRIDGNYVRNSYEPWGSGDYGVRISNGGDTAGEVVGNVSITNNFMESSTGWEAHVWSYAGHDTIPPTGTITIANNTFFGNVNRHGAIVIGNVEGVDKPFPLQNYVIVNNIFGNFIATPNGERDLNLRTNHALSGLISNRNVFDPNGEFIWADGARLNIAGWRGATGADLASRLCVPSFTLTTIFDRHLKQNDGCAKNFGTATLNMVDIDGEARGQLGGVDIGADEVPAQIFADGFESGTSAAWSLVVP